MPIQGEVKVVGPKKRKKEPVVKKQDVQKTIESSGLFVIKDSKYHQDMFNRDLKKSN